MSFVTDRAINSTRMTQTIERTVLFADLRGSTALYERLGNAEATAVVTQSVALLARVVVSCDGAVVKTLGDGLMAAFDNPRDGIKAAMRMQELLLKSSARSERLRHTHLQIALARGEVVEIHGDCFGDAVNVAARLLDHAGDGETVVTAEVVNGLTTAQKSRFRSLDHISVRGRAEPVHIYVLDQGTGDAGATQFGEIARTVAPEGIRLVWQDLDRVFDIEQMPIVLGRSTQATYCITDVRVSRSHARIDWQGSSFSLTDLSYNGTFVRFGAGGQTLSLRRGSCTLHGAGAIGLGGAASESQAPTVRFEVIHLAEAASSALMRRGI